jgi:hypothetical protein
MFHLKWTTGINGVLPAEDIILHVIVMNELHPTPVLYPFIRETGVFHPLLIDLIDVAVWLSGEYFLRH